MCEREREFLLVEGAEAQVKEKLRELSLSLERNLREKCLVESHLHILLFI